MIAIDVAADPPRLHLLPFERAGRWASRPALEPAPACVAAGLVKKGRPLSVEPATDPVRTWAEARLALPCVPGEQARALEDFTALCRVPVFAVGVPARGPLTPLAQALIAAEPRKRLDDAGAHGHPAADLAAPMPSPDDLRLGEAARLTRAPNVAWRVLDGQAVLVAPSSPLVHTLNAVGTLVWERADGRAVSSIVDEVVNEFAVTRTQAMADVELFVRDLLNKHLITVADAGAP
jgi:Coenzyme PQQ synthesis protein D (PqqD)